MLNAVLGSGLVALGVLTVVASVRNWKLLFDEGHPALGAGRVSARLVYGTFGAIVTMAGLISVLRPLV